MIKPGLYFSFLKRGKNPIERIKAQVLFVIIVLAAIGEVFLIISDLVNGQSVCNNIIILVFLLSSMLFLIKGNLRLAAYVYLLPFAVDFFRAYFTGGGIETRALPLFFLLIVLAIYLLDVWHAAIFISLMLITVNLDIPLELSARFAAQSIDDPGDYGKRFVILNLITIAMSIVFAAVFYLVNRFFKELVQHNEHLDELVKERTEQLEEQNPEAA